MPILQDNEPLISRESEFAERVNKLGFKPPAKPQDFMALFSVVEQPGITGSQYGPSREEFELALARKQFPAELIRLASFVLEQALLPPYWINQK